VSRAAAGHPETVRGTRITEAVFLGRFTFLGFQRLNASIRPPVWRRAFDSTLGALADALDRMGVRPNMLTWLSLAPAAASLVASAMGHFRLAVAMMLCSGFCDLLDGPLARRTGQTSKFGALLDSTLDRFADAAPLLGLAYFYAPYPNAALAAAAAVFGGYSVSYVRARAEGLNINLPPLWMRRTERLVITGVGLLLAPITVPDIDVPAPFTLLTVCILGALSLIAAAHALWAAANITRVKKTSDVRISGR
jgi:CDP-diacylglycerol--glycerol-3-phosphate 3-phosphatidyltransferase